MASQNIQGQPAITISGKIIKEFKNRQTMKISVFVDCDGDKEWFPKSAVKDNEDGTVSIQEWIYKIKFPKG